jgi:uncharacterized protein with ATP-grasp and redox domains
MRISESCAKCLYDRQAAKTDNAAYLAEVKDLLDRRGEDDTTALMGYRFNRLRAKYFGEEPDFRDVKKQYNDLLLDMEEQLRGQIESAPDPLSKALIMSRIGNYIDYGAAMYHVDREEFLSLFTDTEMQERDLPVYESFLRECEAGKNLLLLCDNCGEIVLDKLFLEQIRKRFPHLKCSAMVRGGEVVNDATDEDARYVGLDRVAEILTNGMPIAGTIPEMLPSEARAALEEADVILSKGQANYESMYGRGMHVFYTFLCKCDLFINRFQVPKLTGIFVEE